MSVDGQRGEQREGGVLGFGPGVGGGEEPVGPFLGELAGFAEDDRHVGPADLEFGETIGDQGGPDPVELEHLGVAVLDDDRGARQCRQLGHREAELAAGQTGHEVDQGFAFDRGHQPPAEE